MVNPILGVGAHVRCNSEQALEGVSGILVIDEELAVVLQEIRERVNGEIVPVPALADQERLRRRGGRVSKKELRHNREVAATSPLVSPQHQ